jgi:DNA primase
MKTYQDIKSAATIDAIIHYAETLLGIRFQARQKKSVQRPMPIPRRHQDSFMVYVNKDDEVRFHCFGACKAIGTFTT